jgi:hypothetical protein
MLAESGAALTASSRPLEPDQIALSYWYAAEPRSLHTITYSQEQHETNWADIQKLVADINECLQQDQWPLTDNWSHCRSCAYWAYCGRFEAGTPKKILAEEPSQYEFDPVPFLEPESP